MAIDEALLNLSARDGEPRFRFYTWTEPTVSLGYFQDRETFWSAFPHLRNLALVRRLTGGGAILHDREITYALIMPADTDIYRQGAMSAYTKVHEAIANALKKLGVTLELRPKTADYMRIKDEPEFCFARPCPTDLICSAGKMVGSAQRRLPGAFLQHGSIMLENRFPDQPMATLSDLAGQLPAPTDLEQMIADELTATLGIKFDRRDFQEAELSAAEPLIAKYTGEKWTVDREK
jgi:lipoate-protein ligase A